MIRSGSLFSLLVGFALLAGCGGASPSQPPAPTSVPPVATVVPEAPVAAPTEVPATPVQPAATTPAAAPAPDPAALCPAATAGTILYVSVENGFCALYPSSLTLSEDVVRPDEVFHLVGAVADPNAIESGAVLLGVA